MDWDQHLAYEINELCRDLDRLYGAWPGMQGATPTKWTLPDAIAYFEALLVHARNLIELLLVESGKHPDALTIEDFGVHDHDYPAARRRFFEGVHFEVDEMYSQICTYVSHLSKSRDVEPPYWPLQPLADTLVDEAEQLANAAERGGAELPMTRAAIAEWRGNE